MKNILYENSLQILQKELKAKFKFSTKFNYKTDDEKLSHMSNLGYLINPSKPKQNNGVPDHVQSFYIQKMSDFGFDGFDDKLNAQFESKSEPLFSAMNQVEIDSGQTDLLDDKLFLKHKYIEHRLNKIANRSSTSRVSSNKNLNDIELIPNFNAKIEHLKKEKKFGDKFSRQNSKKYSQSARTSSKLYSSSLIILPELTELTDETIATSNGVSKDSVKNPSVSNHKMSRQLLASANRHISSRTQNELTLPPIVETQISTANNQNANNSKKSNSSTRVDSGIAIDYPNDNQNNGGGWTLSPNESENGGDNNTRIIDNGTTTFELVENNLKKNNTSSTLNSLGKSSSIQSKLTTTTNISTNSSKFSQSFNGNNNLSSSVSNVTTKIVPISIIQSEQNYINSFERMGSSIDPHEFQNPANMNKIAKTHHSNDNKWVISNQNNNRKELNTSNSNLESLKNSQNTNKTYQSSKSAKPKDLQDRQVPSNLTNPSVQRQNTMTTIIHENLPNASRRNSNSTIANVSTTPYQSARPIPRPRPRIESTRRSLSLQKNDTSIPLASTNSTANKFYNNTQNHFKTSSNINRNHFKSTQINSINNLKRDPNFQMHRQSTNFNLRSQSKPKENTNRPKTTVITPQTNEKSTVPNTPVKKVEATKHLKNIKNAPIESVTSTTEIINEPEPIIAFELPETSESSIFDFTLERIHKWLDEMENCEDMLQPPSQLTWRDVNNSSNKTPNEFSRNFNNEYCLSDYDSNDEQIVEYNRVVDKTFHIVHDETEE